MAMVTRAAWRGIGNVVVRLAEVFCSEHFLQRMCACFDRSVRFHSWHEIMCRNETSRFTALESILDKNGLEEQLEDQLSGEEQKINALSLSLESLRGIEGGGALVRRADVLQRQKDCQRSCERMRKSLEDVRTKKSAGEAILQQRRETTQQMHGRFSLDQLTRDVQQTLIKIETDEVAFGASCPQTYVDAYRQAAQMLFELAPAGCGVVDHYAAILEICKGLQQKGDDVSPVDFKGLIDEFCKLYGAVAGHKKIRVKSSVVERALMLADISRMQPKTFAAPVVGDMMSSQVESPAVGKQSTQFDVAPDLKALRGALTEASQGGEFLAQHYLTAYRITAQILRKEAEWKGAIDAVQKQLERDDCDEGAIKTSFTNLQAALDLGITELSRSEEPNGEVIWCCQFLKTRTYEFCNS